MSIIYCYGIQYNIIKNAYSKGVFSFEAGFSTHFVNLAILQLDMLNVSNVYGIFSFQAISFISMLDPLPFYRISFLVVAYKAANNRIT
jgi:hypothetical protein